jgi:hypothetical protein
MKSMYALAILPLWPRVPQSFATRLSLLETCPKFIHAVTPIRISFLGDFRLSSILVRVTKHTLVIRSPTDDNMG